MDLKAAHVVADIRQGEVFGCIPHGRGAYRERDSFAMWAGHLLVIGRTKDRRQRTNARFTGAPRNTSDFKL